MASGSVGLARQPRRPGRRRRFARLVSAGRASPVHGSPAISGVPHARKDGRPAGRGRSHTHHPDRRSHRVDAAARCGGPRHHRRGQATLGDRADTGWRETLRGQSTRRQRLGHRHRHRSTGRDSLGGLGACRHRDLTGRRDQLCGQRLGRNRLRDRQSDAQHDADDRTAGIPRRRRPQAGRPTALRHQPASESLVAIDTQSGLVTESVSLGRGIRNIALSTDGSCPSALVPSDPPPAGHDRSHGALCLLAITLYFHCPGGGRRKQPWPPRSTPFTTRPCLDQSLPWGIRGNSGP